MMLGVRMCIPSVSSDVKSMWYANAVASLPDEEREATLANPRKMLQPRSLKVTVPFGFRYLERPSRANALLVPQTLFHSNGWEFCMLTIPPHRVTDRFRCIICPVSACHFRSYHHSHAGKDPHADNSVVHLGNDGLLPKVDAARSHGARNQCTHTYANHPVLRDTRCLA